MSNIEGQLRAALRRHDPPAGFADRVLKRTARRPRLLRRSLWSMGAIAATLALVSLSALIYQHSREERAARQAELALRIASEKLNLARDRVLRNVGPRDY